MFFNFINFHSIPFHSQCDFDYDYDVVKRFIDEKMDKDDEFYIVCLNEVYSYRSGIFGSLFNYLAKCFTNQPTCLKNYLNSHSYKNNPFFCNDFDIIASYCSYLNKFIPILNLGSVNSQHSFFFHNFEQSKLKYLYNDSHPPPFCSSMLDSGCGFLSNKIPLYKGFVSLEKSNTYFDKLVNKGIQWNYFEENDNGFLFITFNLSQNLSNEWKLYEIEQIICLANEIQLKYVDFDFIHNFQCIIIGDFRIELWNVAPVLTAFTVNHLYETTYALSYNKNLNINRSSIANQIIISINDHESKKRKRTDSYENECKKINDEDESYEFEGISDNYDECKNMNHENTEIENAETSDNENAYESYDISDNYERYESDGEAKTEVFFNPLVLLEDDIEEIKDVIVEIKEETIFDAYFSNDIEDEEEGDIENEWTRI
jgi:hypothetical protein